MELWRVPLQEGILANPITEKGILANPTTIVGTQG